MIHFDLALRTFIGRNNELRPTAERATGHIAQRRNCSRVEYRFHVPVVDMGRLLE